MADYSLKDDWKRRVRLWIDRMPELFTSPIQEISLEGALTFKHLNIEEASRLNFKPMPTGTPWGEKWEYAWFKTEITLPKEAEGQRIVFLPGVGLDSAVYVNGDASGAKDHHHHEVVLTQNGVPGESFQIMIESYAGHGHRAICGGGPILDGKEFIPETGPTQKRIDKSMLAIWNEPLFQLWMDAMTLEKLRNSLSQDSLRVQEIQKALCQMTIVFDIEEPLPQLLKSAEEARTILRPLLECRNGSTAPTFYCFGHSHLDVAWCWPLRETESKATRTFGTQLELLKEYPEMTYLQSQPHLYWMVKNKYPKLYSRIKEAVQGGRWIPEGGMWVEPDANMSGGESLIRQCLHGKKFFKEEFGVDNQLLWMPDVFGCTAALPQIMKGCGLDYFSSHKMFWGVGRRQEFPYQSFWWRGIDGTEVFAHLHNHYNSEVDPTTLINKWSSRKKHSSLSSRLVPYGWGDGGGGPTRQHQEYLARQQDLEGAPRCRHSHPLDFFRDVEAKGEEHPTYVGELYLQTHQGTYTSQAKTKKGNRQSEFALREAEFWSVISESIKAREYPLQQLDGLWKKVLLNQFHDILPGSSLERVHAEAEKDYEEVIRSCGEITSEATSTLTEESPDHITVFNSLSWPRQTLVKIPPHFEGLVNEEGHSLPIQDIQGETFALVSDLPPCGWASFKNRNPQKIERYMKAHKDLLENERLRISVNSQGQFTSIYDKKLNLELSKGNCNAFRMFKDVPYSFDAWNIDQPYRSCPLPLIEEAEIEIKENGPLVASLSIKRKLNNSTLYQEIRIFSGSPRIEFITTIDWHERHKLLKVDFPVNIQAHEAHHEIQFGYLPRPNHASNDVDAAKYEVCQQKWTALFENSHGVALLNDCKYGISVENNHMELTLLKSALAPDAKADQGQHQFTYTFLPWEGPFASSPVYREGYELNSPVLVSSGLAPRKSLFTLDQDNIIIESLKTAEDGSGDIVLRLFESKNMHTSSELKTSFKVSEVLQTNMLEEDGVSLRHQDGAIQLDFRPFEIKTLRIARSLES